MRVIMDGTQLCDFCKAQGQVRLARVDGKTKQGPWAYMCFHCFRAYGIGLGMGKGQFIEQPQVKGKGRGDGDR